MEGKKKFLLKSVTMEKNLHCSDGAYVQRFQRQSF